MKYLLLIYSSDETWQALSESDRERVCVDHAALCTELENSGEYVDGNALTDEQLTKNVLVRAGQAVVTDGPYVEVKEHLAGYDLVECDSAERAVEIAARLPEAALCRIEIRPVLELSGMPM